MNKFRLKRLEIFQVDIKNPSTPKIEQSDKKYHSRIDKKTAIKPPKKKYIKF
jgi:hypothetical protein